MRKLLLAILLSACTHGGNGDDAPTTNGTSCHAILDCIDVCTTNACVDSCVANGSDHAQDLVDSLLTCLEKNACTDFACTQSRCGTQLDTCDADGGTTGGGGGGGGAMLPASLVGSWSNESAQAPISYAFTANGRVQKIGGLFTGSGSCSSSYVQQVDGTVQIAGDLLTLTPTSATFTSYGCDGTTPTNSGTSNASVEHLRFQTGTDAGGAFLVLANVDTGSQTTLRRL